MEKNVMSAQMLEVSLLGVGTVLRLERDAWSMVKWLRQATNEYASPPPVHICLSFPSCRGKNQALPHWFFFNIKFCQLTRWRFRRTSGDTSETKNRGTRAQLRHGWRQGHYQSTKNNAVKNRGKKQTRRFREWRHLPPIIVDFEKLWKKLWTIDVTLRDDKNTWFRFWKRNILQRQLKNVTNRVYFVVKNMIISAKKYYCSFIVTDGSTHESLTEGRADFRRHVVVRGHPGNILGFPMWILQ